MARLIDADALIRDMEENPPSYGDMDNVIAAVNNAPTVGKKDSDRADYEQIIIHLQIIRTWAEVDRKYGGIKPDCCEYIVTWIDEALELLKEESDGNRK